MRLSRTVLSDLFRRAFARHAERPAIAEEGRVLTYQQLADNAARLAHALRGEGIRAGDPIVLLLRNSPEFVIADLALAMVGAAKVPLNDMLSAPDVGDMIKHSGAKGIIAHTSFAETLAAIEGPVADLSLRVAITDDQTELATFTPLELLTDGEPTDWPDPIGIESDTVGLIIYTGGTTGKSKGVVHTQQALFLNFLSHIACLGLQPDEKMLICSPLPHSAQLFAASALLQGGMIWIERAFEPGRVLELVEREKLTFTFMVPTMINRLLDHPDAATRNTDSIRTIVYGASPISPTRMRQAVDRFGPVLLQIYGQTETPNLITTLSKADHGREGLETSCGQPTMFCDVVIRDEDGNALPVGDVGEITVRSNYSLECYHDAPDKTAETYTGQYVRTGDVGYFNESGHMFLVDRAKDMIISGGMNVYSTEVENIIQQLDDVGQVTVIGVPDEDWGEAVAAFVVPANGESFDTERVKAHCKQLLAKYKVPKRIESVGDIPLTAYGKPDKKALRQRFWEGRERAIN